MDPRTRMLNLRSGYFLCYMDISLHPGFGQDQLSNDHVFLVLDRINCPIITVFLQCAGQDQLSNDRSSLVLDGINCLMSAVGVWHCESRASVSDGKVEQECAPSWVIIVCSWFMALFAPEQRARFFAGVRL